MKRSRMILFLLIAHMTVFAGNNLFSEDAISGNWLIGNKDAKITIFKTGGYYYGKIAWLRNPNKEDGTPKTDQNNPDEKLRNRHVLGLLLLKGFEYSEKEQAWINGEVYDPKNGKNYSCIIRMKDNNTIEVRGYLGISLIGRTDTWTRTN